MTIDPANDTEGCRKSVIDIFDHMHVHSDWWREARDRLMWEPIQALPLDLDNKALAEPVIQRSANQRVIGLCYEGGWIRVAEGAHYRLDHFQPIQWAEPTIDDHLLLAEG